MVNKKITIDHQTLHPLIQEEITSQASSLDDAMRLAEKTLQEHGHHFMNSTVCMVSK